MVSKDLKEDGITKVDVLDRTRWKQLICKGSAGWGADGFMNNWYRLTQVYMEKCHKALCYVNLKLH